MKDLCCVLSPSQWCLECGDQWCDSHLRELGITYPPSPPDHHITCLQDKERYYFCPVIQHLVTRPKQEYFRDRKINGRSKSLESLL